jgi:hypothetical protein
MRKFNSFDKSLITKELGFISVCRSESNEARNFTTENKHKKVPGNGKKC